MKPGGGGHKDQKQKEGPAKDGPAKKVVKRPKPSLEEIPVHHLVLEDDAVEEKTKVLKPDTLWLHAAERITPWCATCKLKAIQCITTGKQLACVSCHTGKVKCLYSTAHKAKLAASSGEGTSKAARKRKQENINDDYEVSSSRASKKPWGASTDTAAPLPVPVILTSSKFTPSVAGLQVSVGELHASVKSMEEQMRILASENKMIWGWMEMMMIAKEKMLVTLPVVQQELWAFRDGMELEKLHGKVQALEDEVNQAHL